MIKLLFFFPCAALAVLCGILILGIIFGPNDSDSNDSDY